MREGFSHESFAAAHGLVLLATCTAHLRPVSDVTEEVEVRPPALSSGGALLSGIVGVLMACPPCTCTARPFSRASG